MSHPEAARERARRSFRGQAGAQSGATGSMRTQRGATQAPCLRFVPA